MKTVITPQNKETVEETAQNKSWLVKNTTFSEALTEMKSDHKTHCKRVGWDYEIVRFYPEEGDLVLKPYLVADINDEYEVWYPSNSDLFANDWQIRGFNSMPIAEIGI